MPFYRILIKPKGSWETELVSGTLWGHLAWIIRYRDGEDKFKEWLDEQIKNPWLISSWMPKGYLPRPNLRPMHRQFDEKPPIEQMQKSKKIKKIKYIKEATFIKLRNSLNEYILNTELNQLISQQEHRTVTYIQPHNTINRLSGTTPDEGGLFFQDVSFLISGEGFQVFIYTPKDEMENLKEIFKILEDYGIGSNKSTGKGFFSYSLSEEKTLFNCTGNRAMSLSHGILTRNMKDSLYKIHVHFGKLGGSYANSNYSPFKYPIIMVKQGATFSPDKEDSFSNTIYGKILDDVHHSLKEIRHYAVHLPIYFTEVS